jgi:putative Mn2+ efflux pump MntP
MASVPIAGPIELTGADVALIAGIGLALLLIFVFDVWMIIDAIARREEDFKPPGSRIWWVIAMIAGVATSLPGLPIAIAYFLIVRRPARAGERSTPAGTVMAPHPPQPPPGPEER